MPEPTTTVSHPVSRSRLEVPGGTSISIQSERLRSSPTFMAPSSLWKEPLNWRNRSVRLPAWRRRSWGDDCRTAPFDGVFACETEPDMPKRLPGNPDESFDLGISERDAFPIDIDHHGEV